MSIGRGGARVSTLDAVYRSLLLSKFFTKGWGKPEHLKRIFRLRRELADRRTALPLLQANQTVVTLANSSTKSDHTIVDGHFTSPAVKYLPGLIPKESETVHFQLVLPRSWPNPKLKPMVVQYAGTGDHFFWRRRRLMAVPMVKERGVGSVILECPFYGLRKPKEQFRSSLQNVSDLFVMGACLIMESWVIYDWCERQGYGPLVSHGVSMGGHMASLGVTVWPKPIALVPCLSWTSGSVTFTKGVMTGAINWDLLSRQFESTQAYKEDVAHLVHCEEDAFRAGKEFSKNMDVLAGQSKLEKDGQGCNEVRETPAASDEASNFLERFQLPFLSSLGSTLSLTSMKGGKRKAATAKDGEESQVSSPWTYMLPKIIRNDLGEDNVAKRAAGHDCLHREAVQFMRGIMDECTHLKNFDVPVDPELIFIVVAEMDAYQPREGISSLPDLWPGAKMRQIEGNGHIASYLFKQDVFRRAIYEAIDLYTWKYPLSP